jgi:mRNA-degrading endonuclease toxin of MazEF toxin-antitoxin module
MKQGDIYLISLDPTLGHEQQGKRPVLVVSPEAFNQVTKMPIVLPITSGGRFARNLGFAVELLGGKTTGIVRCDQPRALDFEARKAKFLEKVSSDILDDVMARFTAIFEG